MPGAVDEGEEAVELAGKPGERDGWCCNLLGSEERTFGRLQLAEEQDQGDSEINIVRKELVDRPTQLICNSDIYLYMSTDKYKRHSRAIC